MLTQAVVPLPRQMWSFLCTTTNLRVMPAVELIVCETTCHWSTFLRHEISVRSQERARIRECRDLYECDELLQRHPASFVVLEVDTARLEATTMWLGRVESKFPHARMVALVERPTTEIEAILREAGALSVIASVRELATAVDLWRRHTARVLNGGQTVNEQVWDRLPWDVA